MNTWRNYIGHIYENTSRPERVSDFGQRDNLPIMTEEVDGAMSQIKKHKSHSSDNVYGDF